MCKMQLCTRKPDGLVEAARKKAMHEHQCTSWCFSQGMCSRRRKTPSPQLRCICDYILDLQEQGPFHAWLEITRSLITFLFCLDLCLLLLFLFTSPRFLQLLQSLYCVDKEAAAALPPARRSVSKYVYILLVLYIKFNSFNIIPQFLARIGTASIFWTK